MRLPVPVARRSFEVNVLPSHSDSTSSSGVTTTSYFARSSSEDTTGKSPFDDNEDQGFSSEDDTGIFYTESDSMRRLSSSDIYDSILGPRLQFAPRSQSQLEMSDDFGERGSMQEDTDDFSMMMQDFNNDDSLNLKFSKHRSSIPEPLRGPLLSNDNGDTQDFSKPSEGAGTSTYTSQMSEHSGLVTDEDTDMDITSPIGVGIHALAQEEPPKTFAQDEDNTEIFSDGGTTMEMTLPIGHGIVQISGESTSANSESHASLDWQGMNSGVNGVTGSSSSPPTHSAGLTHEFQKENATYSTRPHDDEPQQPPSTPPRRVSLLREGASLPSTPRRSLGTPGKFTSKTHAQLNVFLDNVERQLKSVESCAPAPPIYRVSHVSPETSNLTKRIARYSIGTTFSAPESIQDRLASMQDTNPDDNTMDFDQAFLSQQIPHEDSIFDERITLAGASQLSTQPSQLTQPSQPSQSSDLFQQSQSLPVTRPFMGSNITTERRVVDATQDDNVESTADESFGELPPITLNKFLGLIGISFLEFSVTSRRRTLPPKPVVADSSMDDILTQMTCLLAEVESYKNGCGMLKSFVEDSRKMTAEVEQQVNDENPDFIREYREGDGVFKEFVKERLKLLRAHCRLETFESFHYWRDDLYVYQQETLEYHKAKLGEDTSTVRKIGKSVSQLSEHVTKRHAELKRQLEEFRQRKSSFAQYDKDRMASLAEDIEEQGSQLEQFRTIVVNKRKEQAEIAAKEEQTRLIEQGFVERIAVAEKTIEEHSFAKPEDIVKSKNALSALQAIHGWEQLGQSSLPMSVTSATALQNGATKLEFVHDRSLKASIDMSKVGKVDSNNTDNPAIQLSLLEDEGLTFGLSLAEGPKMSIRGTAPKALVSLKEYAGLLKDFSSMIASKYSTNVGISKILYDINLYWTKVKSIYRQVEQVRARHTVDLVAGSAENLKELEANNNNNNNGNNNSSNNDGVTNNQNGRRPTTAPIVLLDIRVLFLFSAFGSSWKKKTTTTKKKKISKSTRQQNRGHHQGQDDGDGHMTDEENESHEPAEPFKFYIWFTFTLDDLMNFPAPNSLTWRLEVVYGNISRNQIAEAVAPCIKKGGYNMLREACKNINGLKKQ
ncbi:hypothetical protein BG004_004832 [Podila humilis]|nr:hypothetical protein BG004_004832 [Podila humilis]